MSTLLLPCSTSMWPHYMKTDACRPAWLCLLLTDQVSYTAVQVDDDDNVTLIDFPQMVSVSHENGKELFDRDMECIIRFEKPVCVLDVESCSLALEELGIPSVPFSAGDRQNMGKLYWTLSKPCTRRAGPLLHSGPTLGGSCLLGKLWA